MDQTKFITILNNSPFILFSPNIINKNAILGSINHEDLVSISIDLTMDTTQSSLKLIAYFLSLMTISHFLSLPISILLFLSAISLHLV